MKHQLRSLYILSGILILSGSLAGCSSSSGTARSSAGQTAKVEDVLKEGMAKEDNKETEAKREQVQEQEQVQEKEKEKEKEKKIESEPEKEPEQKNKASAGPADNIDIDLTALSSTMVYSEVYNMMDTPEDYIGKVIKMDGIQAYYYDEDADKYYFACIIMDATACCSQGIEYILNDTYTYPDDYPEAGEEVCVIGRFDTYKEGEFTYCTLRNAALV